jgi:hypothetical protein
MHKSIITISILLASFCGLTQAKRFEKGMRAGEWTIKSMLAEGKMTETGVFNIIPLSTYHIIKSFGTGTYEVKYKKSTPLLFYEQKKEDHISVKDGLWNMYNEAGRQMRISFWNNGLEIWTKYFDENGELTRYDYDDLENDTSFYYTYIDKQIFKKAFYPPENKNNPIEIYYPENDLSVSDAELNFHVNFLNKQSDTQYVFLSSKKELPVHAVSCRRNSIMMAMGMDISCSSRMITPETPVVLRLISRPSALNYEIKDTIIIKTSENKPAYKIYCNIYASHINDNNVEVLKKLTLSKSKDKYLVIPSLGTVTGASISNQYVKGRAYDINKITKIDLSEYPVGNYNLYITSCHTGGELTLVITE